MPRPKKAPALPAPDLSAVQQILAKARSIVATSGKRKGSTESLESPDAPPTSKPKGSECVTKAAPVSPPSKAAPQPPPPPPSQVASGGSSKSSPSYRTQQYLKNVKAQQIAAKATAVASGEAGEGDVVDPKDDGSVVAKCGADVPKAAGDAPKDDSLRSAATSPAPTELITPPPKVPAVKSPPVSPPKMKPLPYVSTHDENDDRWNYGHSQKEYYASKGQSWWRDGWDYDQGNNWFYDHYQKKYVVCTAEGAWAYDDWNHEANQVDGIAEAEGTPTVPSTSTPTSALEGPTAAAGVVHSKLAARQPTFPSPHEETEPTPGEEDTPNLDGAVDGEGGGGGGDETPAAAEVETEEPPGDENPDEHPDAWRCDKNGVQLQPQALYMRFYRRVRSTSPKTKKTVLVFFNPHHFSRRGTSENVTYILSPPSP